MRLTSSALHTNDAYRRSASFLVLYDSEIDRFIGEWAVYFFFK